MPISSERLLSDVNAHLVVPSTYTVKQALQAWSMGHPHFGTGREWWWLIIAYQDGHYTAVPLEQLRDLLAASVINLATVLNTIPFAQDNPENWAKPLPGVVRVRSVDINSYNTSAAVQLAENSPGNVLVVTQNGQVVGIINKRMRNFAMATLSLLSLLDDLDDETTEFPSTPPPTNPESSSGTRS